MKKINILLLLFIMTSFTLKAQNLDRIKDIDKNKKFTAIIRLSYIKNYDADYEITIPERGTQKTNLSTNNAYAKSLNVILAYYVMPKRLSLGIGFGLDRYEEPGFNSAPLYGDIRFYLTNKRNVPYLYANLGTLAKLGPDFVKGRTGEIGVGYKFFVSKKLCLNAQLSYTAKEASFINEFNTLKETVGIKGIALSIGFVLF